MLEFAENAEKNCRFALKWKSQYCVTRLSSFCGVHNSRNLSASNYAISHKASAFTRWVVDWATFVVVAVVVVVVVLVSFVVC